MSGSSRRLVRKERKQKRYKQKKINTKLKKKLFGHLFIIPCYYCKRAFLYNQLTIEHIMPLCLGGTNDPSNITLACGPCNQERGRDSYFYKRNMDRKNYEQYHSKH